MHPVICRIGSLSIYSWGTMLALAFLIGLIVAIRYGKKEGISAELILDLFIYVVISSIVGARVFYVIAFFSQYRDNILSIFLLNQGGMVFLGGLLFAMAAVLLYVRSRKQNVWRLLDALSPASAIGYAVGRIGCYLNGCCYGVTILGVQQPTQLYSSMSGLIIFIVLAYLYGRKKYDGQIFLTGLLLYSVYRFMIEFVRFSPVHYLIFTPNQLLAACILIISGYTLWKKNTTSL